MALYSNVSAETFSALLQVGMEARIKCAASDGYLGVRNGLACIVSCAKEASLWYFISRDQSEGKNASMPRCAVALVNAPDDVPHYLSIYMKEPQISETPAAVRVVYPKSAEVSAQSLRVSFRQVLQQKQYLSVYGSKSKSGALTLRPECGVNEQFNLEVYEPSIGRGYTTVDPLPDRFVSVSHAVLVALLELHARFRLRSVHGRILHVSSGVREGDWGESDPVCVLQDGPRSKETEIGDHDIVFSAVRSSGKDDNQRKYLFREVNHGRVLSIYSSNKEVSRRQRLLDTVAVLVRSPGDLTSDEIVRNSLRVVPADSEWSTAFIGGIAVGTEKDTQWLMAGPRGRLETRSHTGAWESFRFEFVEQTICASLKELPSSQLYSEADASDRVNMRCEIAAQVSEARSQPKSGDSFNYTAALKGLKSDPKEAKQRSKSNGRSEDNKSSASSSQAASKASAAVASGAASVVTANPGAQSGAPPRKSKKKAGKKNKRKKQSAQDHKMKESGQRASSSTKPTLSEVPSQTSDPGESGESGESPDGSDALHSGKNKSSQTASPSNETRHSGSICFACGRPIVGSYTKALGKDFHSECFCCRACRRPISLGAQKFREHKGAPYCNGCYSANIAPKCARCAEPIVDTVTTAMEKTWHKECLTCVQCRLPLTETFWIFADKPKEPRCNRCVTGSEQGLPGRHHSSRGGRVVNLPGSMFQPRTQAPSLTETSMNTAGKGRARLNTPAFPFGR